MSAITTPTNNNAFINQYVNIINSRHSQTNGKNFNPTPKNKANLNKKISFNEGLGLIKKGFINKAKGLCLGIIQNPTQAIASVVGISLVLAATPLIGISTTMSAAFFTIALGFFSVLKIARNYIQFSEHSMRNKNDEARKNLGELGGNCFDLTLTLPLLPKSFGYVKRHKGHTFTKPSAIHHKLDGTTKTKYFSFIDELKSNIRAIKKAKTFKEKIAVLRKKDNFEMKLEKLNKAYIKVAKAQGYKKPPKLFFYNEPMVIKQIKNAKGREVMRMSYTGGYTIGKDSYSGLNISVHTRFVPQDMQICLNKVIGHEFRHYQQFSKIVRAEGLKHGFNEALVSRYLLDGPIIKAGSKESIQAQKFWRAQNNPPKTEKSFVEYQNNLLEKDASINGGVIIGRQILNAFNQSVGSNNITSNPIKVISIITLPTLANNHFLKNKTE